MMIPRYGAAALVALAGAVGCTGSAQRTFTDPETEIGVTVTATGWLGSVEIQARLADPGHTGSIAGLVLRLPDGSAVIPRRVRVELDEPRFMSGPGVGRGRLRDEAVARRRGGWDPPRATDADLSDQRVTLTHRLSDVMLLNRARMATGIDAAQATVPVPGGETALGGYAVGVLVFAGPARMPLAVILPLDAGKPVHKPSRPVRSPTELALEMRLNYVRESGPHPVSAPGRDTPR